MIPPLQLPVTSRFSSVGEAGLEPACSSRNGGFSYHFGFRRPARVRGLDYTLTVGARRRSLPSSLYTFLFFAYQWGATRVKNKLSSVLPRRGRGFTEFDSIPRAVSPPVAQFLFKSPVSAIPPLTRTGQSLPTAALPTRRVFYANISATSTSFLT